MLISDYATVKWNPKNKHRLCDLGYVFTKMGDTIDVKLCDLSRYSNATVSYTCDYCGKLCTNRWEVYQRLKTTVAKDCCKDCLQRKVVESVQAKYGSFQNMFDAAQPKRIRTNILKFGCSNPFGNEAIKNKIVQTNMDRYGVMYTQQNGDVRNKTNATCKEKYGVENYVELFKGKYIRENSPCWKGGPDHSRVERATHEYIQWRKSVFDRDGYMCQKCFVKSGSASRNVELNAHHILNWRDNVGSRYDLDNGITLCARCHTEFHKIYGKHNNTREQLEHFLNKPDEKIC